MKKGLKSLIRKVHFFLIPSSGRRTKYLIRHKKLFKDIGENFFIQSRIFPDDPELILIGDNVKISSNVRFINHDIIRYVFNDDASLLEKVQRFRGCIEIGNNVMIGANVTILPNVKIGNQVIVGANSVITKDIPDGVIVGGNPARIIGSYNSLYQKRKQLFFDVNDEQSLWESFEKNHK